MNKAPILSAVIGVALVAGVAAQVNTRTATATATTVTYYACKDSIGRVSSIRAGVAHACPSGQTVVTWNSQGPKGATGATGAKGATGATGAPGIGVGLWKDTQGKVAARQVEKDEAELRINGYKLLVQPITIADAAGEVTTAKALLFGFSTIYSRTTDCAPPLYFSNTLGAPGYDPYVVAVFYPTSLTPTAGELHVYPLSHTRSLQRIRCRIDSASYPLVPEVVDFETHVYQAVGDINVNATFPPPYILD